MPRLNYKDPADVLDYKNDWSEWLAGTDTISTSTWSASPSGLTVDSSEISDTETVVWLSAGTVDTRYEVTNHIATVAGREKDATRYIVLQSL